MAPGATTGEPRSREHWVLLVLALLAPLGMLGLGWALEPDPRGLGTHEQLGFRPCLPVRLWNLPCPGCGVTTATVLATRGHLWRSLRTQPLGLVVVGLVLGFLAWALIQHGRGRDLWQELQRLSWRPWGPRLLWFSLLAWGYKIAVVRSWIPP